MKNVLKGILGLVAVLTAILLFNAYNLGDVRPLGDPAKLMNINIQKAVDRLSGGIKIPTISQMNSDKIDYKQFLNFNRYLRREFPKVFNTLESYTINKHSLILKWGGIQPLKKPILLMAHMDVVPIDDQSLDQWTHPPFNGETDSTTVWGRGTMDDKGSLFAIMESVDQLIANGHQPAQTIYIAFGHDEEIGGNEGAKKSAEYFRKNGIDFDFILDEGGGITSGKPFGIEKAVAFVAVSEKGYMTLELVAKGTGGHSSMPGKETTIGILANAITKLQANPLPARLEGPTKHMFKAIGAEMKLLPRIIMGNQWLFEGLIEQIFSSSPAGSAVIRTTTAPTIISGGIKDNVIPAQARAMVNFRIIPGDTPESIVDMVHEIVDDPRVEIKHPEGQFGREPAPVSDPTADQFKFLARNIYEVFPSAVVVPGISPGGTDTKHFLDLSPNIYRFSGIGRTDDSDLKRVHGIDERIGIKAYEKGIQFYIHLIESLGQDQKL